MGRILIGNIKGPKGDTGPQGPQGKQGIQGPQGPMPPLTNNFLTTTAGQSALDAAAGKTLKDAQEKLTSDFTNKFSPTEASVYLEKDGRIGAAQLLKNSDGSNDYGTHVTDYSDVYNTSLIIHNGAAKLTRTDTGGNTEIYSVAVDQNLKYQIIDMNGADAVAVPPGRWCANNTLVNGELGPWYIETVEFDSKYRTVTAYPYSGDKRYWYFAKMNNGVWQGWEKYTSVI